jgi:hypothetical protein
VECRMRAHEQVPARPVDRDDAAVDPVRIGIDVTELQPGRHGRRVPKVRCTAAPR